MVPELLPLGPVTLDDGLVGGAAVHQVAAGHVPDFALREVARLQFVAPGEGGGFQVEQLDPDLGDSPERHVGHGRPVNGFHVRRGGFVGPGAGRDDQHQVEFIRQHFGDLPVLQSRGLKLPPKMTTRLLKRFLLVEAVTANETGIGSGLALRHCSSILFRPTPSTSDPVLPGG